MTTSALKIFQDSLTLYYKNWHKLLPYLILLFLPVLILVVLAVVIFYLEVTFKIPAIEFFGDILIVIIFLIGLIINFWAIASLIVSLKNILENQPILPLRAGLKSTYKLLLPAALSSALAALIIFGSTLLAIIPGIITFIWFLFTLYIILFEQTTVVGALKKSKALVVGNWWRIAWGWVLPFALFSIIIAVINLIIITILSPLLSDSILWNAVADRLVGSIVWIALSPAVLSAPLILYLEAKKSYVQN